MLGRAEAAKRSPLLASGRRASSVAWQPRQLSMIPLILLVILAPIFPLRAAENDIQAIIARGTIRVAITKFD